MRSLNPQQSSAGKFWADDEEDQSGDDPQPEDVSQHHDKAEPNPTPSAEVLSKSQKKR